MSQEENTRIWKINGQEFEFDLDDADVFDNMLKAFNELDEEQEELSKAGPTEGFLRSYCEVYYRMFDKLFGPGSGKKIFGGKHNARICEEAAEDFINFANKQVQKVNQRRNAGKKKYQPNRQNNKNYNNYKNRNRR